MAAQRIAAIFACLLAGALLVAGCGGSGDDSESTDVASRAAPPKSEFPAANGRSIAEVLKSPGITNSPLVVLPASMAFYKGENRYSFGVFKRDHTPISDVDVALYFAKVPPAKKAGGNGPGPKGKPKRGEIAKARARARDVPAIGPFPASVESLETKPAFRALTTANDPNAAKVVYVTHINFTSNGEWRPAALIKDEDGTTAALLPSAIVGQYNKVPRVGQKAPLIHTPTRADAGGDLSKITTRVPPDTQNEVDYADVFGKKPIILLFATPQFCQSRVCGPVVDEAEQLKQLYGDKAAFIHMEIYNDNNPDKGVRPQVRAFHLPGEPWLFAIDRHGIIRAEISGAFGVDELTRAVKEVTGGS